MNQWLHAPLKIPASGYHLLARSSLFAIRPWSIRRPDNDPGRDEG